MRCRCLWIVKQQVSMAQAALQVVGLSLPPVSRPQPLPWRFDMYSMDPNITFLSWLLPHLSMYRYPQGINGITTSHSPMVHMIVHMTAIAAELPRSGSRAALRLNWSVPTSVHSVERCICIRVKYHILMLVYFPPRNFQVANFVC
ncbi:uncharacterized protein B0T23DRAFT_373843 [Neurospora hispaniola]|uniref:Uncharacterized protein n=1 Tax=Neurospora hispaniola TaxID=588809 RepID=A0AAJ0ICK3_9PEZI|nr:hypothetical protein B0T23DRAFT_373843 [Neurospora hispaniola]